MSDYYIKLTQIPASDENFKLALGDALLEDLTEALDARAEEGNKSAFGAIRAELVRRYKEGGMDHTDLPSMKEAKEAIKEREDFRSRHFRLSADLQARVAASVISLDEAERIQSLHKPISPLPESSDCADAAPIAPGKVSARKRMAKLKEASGTKSIPQRSFCAWSKLDEKTKADVREKYEEDDETLAQYAFVWDEKQERYLRIKISPHPAEAVTNTLLTPSSVAPGTLQTSALAMLAPDPGVLTLEQLSVIEAPAPVVSLKDLSVPQLAEAFQGLDNAEKHYEKLSGICATMKGLVLSEVKGKLAHGEFLPWLKERFPKSRKTAATYMRLGKEFGKCNPTVTFETLQSDLLATLESQDAVALDFNHPLVSSVSGWVNGRSAYQLMSEIGAARKGGDTKPECPECGQKIKHHENPCPHCGKDSGQEPPPPEDTPMQAAIDIWTPLIKTLTLEMLDSVSWADLPDKGPVSREALEGLWIDGAAKLKDGKPEPKANKEGKKAGKGKAAK